jgi:PucR family transcriptional regulator, purine catabolism regulatory protein
LQADSARPVCERAGGAPAADTDMRAPPDITVRRALELPVLRRGLPEVVAGHDRLDAPIRWVHAGEAANIATLLSGGEMLLSTGMGIGVRAADQRRYVEQLAERGAAALVIELGTVFAELPPALVAAAQRHDLPLVALRSEIPFVAVTEAIHTEIVSSHYALLRRGEQIQRELTGLMLDGEGIPAVLAALATTLNAPVFLEDPSGQLLSHGLPPGFAGDPLDRWEVARIGGRDAVAPGVAVSAVRMGAHQDDGRLLVADLHPPFDAVAGVALQQAAGIVALALLRARQEEELLARERGSVLVSLLDGRIAPAAAGRALLAAGLERVPALVLPLAAETGAATVATGADWDGTLRALQRRLADRGLSAVVGRRPHTGTALALVALRDAAQRAAVAETAAEAVRATVARGLGAEAGEGTTIAVGRASALPDAGAELRLTAESAASATVLPPRPWHDVAALELRRLLWSGRDDAGLAAFSQRVLGTLVAHDRQRKLVLLPTLEALLANGGRKAETARALHLNRQALYHRLTRIEELLGVDLNDPEQLLTLHVALLARQYGDGG